MSIDTENESARCKVVAPPRFGSSESDLDDAIFGTIESANQWVFRFDYLNFYYLNGDC